MKIQCEGPHCMLSVSLEFSNPTSLTWVLQPPLQTTTHQRQEKRKVKRKWGLRICLETVLWGGHNSNLRCQQSSSLSAHQTRVSSGSPVHSANTKHEAAAAVQSRRNREALLSGKKPPEFQETSFGELLSMKSRRAKISCTVQGEPIQDSLQQRLAKRSKAT